MMLTKEQVEAVNYCGEDSFCKITDLWKSLRKLIAWLNYEGELTVQNIS